MHFLLLVVALAIAVSIYVTIATKVDSDGDGIMDRQALVDADNDGIPDAPSTDDALSMCNAVGATIAEGMLLPVYYSGMISYFWLYPVIMVIDSIRPRFGIMTYVSPFIRFGIDLWSCMFSAGAVAAELLVWMLRRGQCHDTLMLRRRSRPRSQSCVRWLVRTMGLGLVATTWLVVATFAVTGRALATMKKPSVSTAIKHVGLQLTWILILMLTCIALRWGVEVAIWVLLNLIMCPLQFISGCTAGFSRSSTYWIAVFSLSYVERV